jgi:lipoic acid synthetase
MGRHCTRDCRFCAIATGPGTLPDPDEPRRLAQAVSAMGLSYVVVTSVTRDDLTDGGASCFAATIRHIHRECPQTLVEVLIPDFQGDDDALHIVIAARPVVINHNIETVRRLYPLVRPGAGYERSLHLIASVSKSDSDIRTKSGLMLGLAETRDEIRETLDDLRSAGCDILTLGQYLQPTPRHIPVERYVTPEEFNEWRDEALARGFADVASGPFVRSSYNAHNLYTRACTAKIE